MTALPQAADPNYLTGALRRAGVLGDGGVRDVVVESSRHTIISHIIRLKLAYDGVCPDAPRSLILKTAHPERLHNLIGAGRHEVAFYSKVAPTMPARLVPRCFDSSFSAEPPAWHLLLEDLTETHRVVTVWPVPPTFDECKIIVRALARVHAYWWDHPALGHSVGEWLDADALQLSNNKFAENLERFTDQLGDRLSDTRRNFYRRFVEAAPRLTGRYLSRRNVTMAHGDAHVWNFLVPQDSASADVRVFDWDSWRVNAGSNDLAYMMALHWYPDRRRAMEQPLLDCYHETLLSHGVQAYDRQALADDYRRSVLWHTTTPVWQHAGNIPPVIWWSHLERIFLAADDLGCHELLD